MTPTLKPIARAPQWLIDRCGRPHTRDHQQTAPPAEVDPHRASQRAIAYLEDFAPTSIEGDAGDATAYRVAARCKDFGCDEHQTLDLMLGHWNERCQPPWSPDELQVKVENAYQYGLEALGVAAPEAQFEPVAPPRPAGGLVELYRDVCPQVGRRALVKGLLDHGAMSVWYGESNAGKSAVVMDMALHIAIGWDWQGQKVDRMAVLYVAAEGPETIRRRVEAFRRKHGDKIGEDVPFAILPHAVDLVHGSDGARRVAEAVAEVESLTGVKVGLVVIDTLSRTLAGGDENSNVDMGSAVKRADQIRVATGAHVLVVHHSGKDKARGARGHSLLRAATDTEIEVEPGIIRVTKQRDYPTGEVYGFALEPVAIGRDVDGDEVTAPVVRSRQASAYEEFGAVLSDRAVAFLRHLDTVPALAAGGCGMPEDDVREEFYSTVARELFPDSRKKAFQRVREEILDSGTFRRDSGTWVRSAVL